MRMLLWLPSCLHRPLARSFGSTLLLNLSAPPAPLLHLSISTYTLMACYLNLFMLCRALVLWGGNRKKLCFQMWRQWTAMKQGKQQSLMRALNHWQHLYLQQCFAWWRVYTDHQQVRRKPDSHCHHVAAASPCACTDVRSHALADCKQLDHPLAEL